MAKNDHVERTETGVRTPVFTQTGEATFPALDRWRQVGEEEARIAYDMTLRNELSGGTPTVREFEKAWRQWVGGKYSISVMNGTTALYSAFFGIGLGPGDDFLCPSYTWICTLSGALMLGARPVFCESDPESMMLDTDDVRRRITDRTRAIVAVHLWGNVCDMDALPALVHRTPYGKGRDGFEDFVRAGYAVVTQDIRGRYASDGEFTALSVANTGDAEDGYGTVEWAAGQPWCNGRVGTFGTSYDAWLQYEIARLRPPHLVAMSALSIPTELTDLDWPGAFKPARRVRWWLATIARGILRR